MEATRAAALLFAAVVVPHEEQRYPTTGDWMYGENPNPPLKVRVSDMGNRNYEFLVAIHETIEAWLCANAGIEEADVSAFDVAYEDKRRLIYDRERIEAAVGVDNYANLVKQAADVLQRFGCACIPTEESEPGDDIHAPYFHQHQFATSIERQCCSRLGISWDDYENANLALYDEQKPKEQ